MRGVPEGGRGNAGGETELGVVGQGQCLVVVLGADDTHHGAEHLFSVDAHRRRRLGEKGGAHVVAGRAIAVSLDRLAARHQPGAFGPARSRRTARFCASCLSSTTGPMSVPFLRASSTFSAFILLCHRSDEAVVDAFGDDEARRGRAALAGGEEGAVQRRVHRHVQIGVVEHHHRILAAHFQLELGHARDTGLRDALAGGHRAREADRVHAFVVQQHLAHFGAAAHHQVEHARRQARAVAGCRRWPRRCRAPDRPA